jgi:hypothetical protein
MEQEVLVPPRELNCPEVLAAGLETPQAELRQVLHQKKTEGYT